MPGPGIDGEIYYSVIVPEQKDYEIKINFDAFTSTEIEFRSLDGSMRSTSYGTINPRIITKTLTPGEYILRLKSDSGTRDFDVNLSLISFAVDSPQDITFIKDENNNIDKIIWNATGVNADYYVLYENGDVIQNQSWESGFGIYYTNLYFLNLGTYNFTIVIYDSMGNYLVDTVMVTILQTRATSMTTISSSTSAKDTSTSDSRSSGTQTTSFISIEIVVFGMLLLSILKRNFQIRNRKR